MKNFKKILAIILTLSVCYVSSFSVLATEISYDDSYEFVTSESTGEKISIEEIDRLMDEKNEALLQDNIDEYKKINETLDDYGVDTVSLQEVISLTGTVPTFNANEDVNRLYASTATFQTVYSTYVKNGVSYRAMRVYATPNGQTGVLYKTGSTSLRDSATLPSKIMTVLETASSYGVGLIRKIGAVYSAYDSLSSAIDELSPTSTITDIQANYTWNIAETCVFIYFPSTVASGAWIIKGRYSKVSLGVGISIPTLKIDGNNVTASVLQKNYSESAIPKDYNDIDKAFYAYQNGVVYEAYGASDITIRGIEGKIIKTIDLKNPSEPGEIA